MLEHDDDDLRRYLTQEEQHEVDAALRALPTAPWFPLPGAQTTACYSVADIIGYGGAAGGGKTDLACGKALTQHRKVMILRRVGSELTGIMDRLATLLGSRDDYSGRDGIWRTTRYDGEPLQIEMGAVPNLGDEKKYQGRDHDLLVYDEAANFLEFQARFLTGWIRSTTPGQRCQLLMCFNPPTTADGRWIVAFFAPWLDKKHPLYPTQPGQLRIAAMIPDGNGGAKDVWLDRPDPFVLVSNEPTYDFDPAEFEPEDIITPKTRTFIPARVRDNPHLYGTGYMSQLQALPEPLRSQMLNGDFTAGMEDSQWQVIPSRWVELAQERWRAKDVKPEMNSMGVDVARGGRDSSIISRRHGTWFDELIQFSGVDSNTGPKVAGQCISALRNQAPIHIDVVGVGASPYDFLVEHRQQVVGVEAAGACVSTDKSGRLRFSNMRSWIWWNMRELLDPDNNYGVQLPPDSDLAIELCAPNWGMKGSTVYVESRDEIVKRIGRSPDRATAVCLAAMATPKYNPDPTNDLSAQRRAYNPAKAHQIHAQDRREYNPFANRGR